MSYRKIVAEQIVKIRRTKNEEAKALIPDAEEAYGMTALHVMALLLRTRWPSYKRWSVAVTENLDYDTRKKLPLILASKDPGVVYVYPNVPVYEVFVDSPEIMAQVTTCVYLDALVPLRDRVKEELEHEQKKRAWADLKSCRRAICKREKLSVSKVVAKYILPGGKADKIRDLSIKISNQLKPLEFHWAETPEELATMYDSGKVSSCLTPKDGRTWAGLQENDLLPSSFYGYCPETCGFYIAKGDEVVARTIVFKREGKPAHFYKTYPANGPMADALVMELSRLKVTNGTCHPKEPFYVDAPFSKKEKDYIMPVPYFEGLSASFWIKFEMDTRKFHLFPPAGVKGAESHALTAKGYKLFDLARIDSRMVGAKFILDLAETCAYCNKKVSTTTGQCYRIDGETYCQSICVAQAGYVSATQADGQTCWVHKRAAIIDFCDPGYAWTTAYAAKKAGAMPFLSTFSDEVDPNKVSIHGGKVFKGKEEVRISSSHFDMLRSRTRVLGYSLQRKEDGTFELYSNPSPKADNKGVDW